MSENVEREEELSVGTFDSDSNSDSDSEVEKKETRKKDSFEDYTDFEVQSILTIEPLEPCVVWAAISANDDSDPSSYQSVGIPGIYDSKRNKFVTLDGKVVTIKDFNEKLEDYVKGLNQERT